MFGAEERKFLFLNLRSLVYKIEKISNSMGRRSKGRRGQRVRRTYSKMKRFLEDGSVLHFSASKYKEPPIFDPRNQKNEAPPISCVFDQKNEGSCIFFFFRISLFSTHCHQVLSAMLRFEFPFGLPPWRSVRRSRSAIYSVCCTRNIREHVVLFVRSEK